MRVGRTSNYPEPSLARSIASKLSGSRCSNDGDEAAQFGKRCRISDGFMLPLKPAMVKQLQEQRAAASTRVSLYQGINVNLCRSYIAATCADLAPRSLDGLTASLVSRVSGIVSGNPSVVTPSVFKIGITADPVWRFCEAPFAYTRSPVANGHMEVLVAGSSRLCAQLERRLIHSCSSTRGLWNQALGGESSPPASSICYLYVVRKRVDAVIQTDWRRPQTSY